MSVVEIDAMTNALTLHALIVSQPLIERVLCEGLLIDYFARRLYPLFFVEKAADTE